MQVYSLRLETEVREALERAAKADGRSTANLARKIITDWLKRREPKGKQA
jgi:predicted DNA-binding protein